MNKINQKIKQIPQLPGIYKMLDEAGNILYIGKSKNLKNRVRSYFNNTEKSSKIERMLFHLRDLEYIVTDTHLEALLLECKLIKAINPPYNTLLKNDQRYCYLKIEDNKRRSPLQVIPNLEENTIGPFRSRHSLESFIHSMSHLFPIVSNNHQFNFNYVPIPNHLNATAFQDNQHSLIKLFSDSSTLDSFIDIIVTEMDAHSRQLQFERALFYRDLLNHLKTIQRILFYQTTLLANDLIITIPLEKNYKLLYLHQARIAAKLFTDSLDLKKIKTFYYETKDTLALTPKDYDKKSTLDFMEILISEIQTFPPEWIFKSTQFDD